MKKIIAGLVAATLLQAAPLATVLADSGSDMVRAEADGTYAQDFIIKHSALYRRLRGLIIMKPQGNGEAYYVSPTSPKLVYLGHGRKALDSLLYQSTGISDAAIKGVLPAVTRWVGLDSDRDGLGDNLERSIGTDPLNFNSDDDRYSDFVEVSNGYDPLSRGRWPISETATEKLKGRILLQVESHGQSWYVNPKDGKRYLFSNQYDTAEMIIAVSTGITNYNFNLLIK